MAARRQLEQRANDLQRRIGDTNDLLVGLQSQIAAAPPSRQQVLRKRAATLLKRRRLYEQQLTDRDGQLEQLERQALVADSLADTAMTAAAMTAGHQQMRAQQRALDPERIARDVDSMRDIMDDASDLQRQLSSAFGSGDDDVAVGDDDLDAELAALVGSAAIVTPQPPAATPASAANSIVAAATLPTPPSHSPASTGADPVRLALPPL